MNLFRPMLVTLALVAGTLLISIMQAFVSNAIVLGILSLILFAGTMGTILMLVVQEKIEKEANEESS